MIIVLTIVYILIGAGLGSFYYFLQLKQDYYKEDIFAALWTGIFWPFVAPFSFGFYYAKAIIERRRENDDSV